MPRIITINVSIITGQDSGASTDGLVYVGVCGREFCANSQADDFERGASRIYLFGEGANVLHTDLNDPRKQVLLTENVDKFPVYIRFQPRHGDDRWQLARAQLWLNDEFIPQWDSFGVLTREGIWLSERSGLILHLPKHTLQAAKE